MKRITGITLVIAAVLALAFAGSISANQPSTPPGQDGSCHGANQATCRPDPQPSHGQDCTHQPPGNPNGNDDHCASPAPSPSPTPTPKPTPTPFVCPSGSTCGGLIVPPTPTPVATPSPTPTPTPTADLGGTVGPPPTDTADLSRLVPANHVIGDLLPYAAWAVFGLAFIVVLRKFIATL